MKFNYILFLIKKYFCYVLICSISFKLAVSCGFSRLETNNIYKEKKSLFTLHADLNYQTAQRAHRRESPKKQFSLRSSQAIFRQFK